MLARTTRARACGIAGLGHEILDYPVKDDTVVEFLPHQFLDPRHVIGGQIGAHFNRHAPIL